MNRPHPDWSVTSGPAEVPLIVEVLNCHQIFGWLSRTQRTAVLDETYGDEIVAHPVVMANLRKRGLLDDDGRLTDVGVLVRKWNRPFPEVTE